MEDTYAAKIDHSADFEIRTDKKGRMFGIKNLRIDVENGNIIGDLAGDPEAGMEYLKKYAKQIMDSLKKKSESS